MQGRLGANDTVIEASSGSTSIALAQACAQLGLRFITVMPEGVSNERVMIIQAYGGQTRLTPKADGIRGAIDETERLARQPHTFLTGLLSAGTGSVNGGCSNGTGLAITRGSWASVRICNRRAANAYFCGA
jgi:cysteine synthase